MEEKEIRESIKHLYKIAQLPNNQFDCFDCEQLINVVFRDLFSFSIRKDGYGQSSTTKVMTSSIGLFYDLRNFSKIEKENKIAEIQIGDVLFFHTQSLEFEEPTPNNKYPGHVALYLGNFNFIHAKSSVGRVVVSNFYEEDYLEILIGYKDYIPYILTNVFEEQRTL